MSDALSITVNDQQVKLALNTFGQRISPQPLLKIAGAVMQGSIIKTFSEEGSPAGSWPRLAPSTLKRLGSRAGGHKLLIRSGRLRNSLAQKIQGNTLTIGTNLVYAAIHQMGGYAGRATPGPNRKSKKPFQRPYIPARPYLVFRPEDPQRMQEAMQTFIDQQARQVGLK